MMAGGRVVEVIRVASRYNLDSVACTEPKWPNGSNRG